MWHHVSRHRSYDAGKEVRCLLLLGLPLLLLLSWAVTQGCMQAAAAQLLEPATVDRPCTLGCSTVILSPLCSCLLQGSGSPTTGTADPTPCSVPTVTETVSSSKVRDLAYSHSLLPWPCCTKPSAALLMRPGAPRA
jgi:hypothetical protein